MEKSQNKKQPTQGEYILNALRHHFLGGDSYIMADELYAVCKEDRKSLAYEAFQRDYAFLMKEGKLHREGRRLYLAGTWAQEEDAAKRLAELLENNPAGGAARRGQHGALPPPLDHPRRSRVRQDHAHSRHRAVWKEWRVGLRADGQGGAKSPRTYRSRGKDGSQCAGHGVSG